MVLSLGTLLWNLVLFLVKFKSYTVIVSIQIGLNPKEEWISRCYTFSIQIGPGRMTSYFLELRSFLKFREL